MTVSYFSSTGRLRFNAAPSLPRQPHLMAVADDPFAPDEIIEPVPPATFRLRATSWMIRTVPALVIVMTLIAMLAMVSRT